MTSASFLKASLCDQKKPVLGAVLTPPCASDSLQGSFTVRMGCFLRLIPPRLRHRQSGSFPTDDPTRGLSISSQEEQAQFCVSRGVKKKSGFSQRTLLDLADPSSGLSSTPECARRPPNLEIVKSFYLLDERRVRRGIRLDVGGPNWLSWPISANEVADFSQG